MKVDLEPDPWAHLVFPASVKQALLSVRRAIQNAASNKAGPGLNVLIYGPPGTGKTQISRGFLAIDGVASRRLGVADFKAGYVGQSATIVQNIFATARSTAPCILSIDTIYAYGDHRLFVPRSSNPYDDEVTVETLIQLDELKQKPCPVFMIAETFELDLIDAAVLARFDVRIETRLPDEAARHEILKQKIQGYPTDPSLEIDEVSSVLAHHSPSESGRSLESIVRRAWWRALASSPDPDHVQLTRDVLLAELHRVPRHDKD